MYCLDTNIIIELFSENRSVIRRIEDLEKASASLWTTPITLCELYKSVFGARNFQTKAAAVAQATSRVGLLAFDEQSARDYGKLHATLRRKGMFTGEADLMIAAICKAHGKILITRNPQHFKNTGIQLEAW